MMRVLKFLSMLTFVLALIASSESRQVKEPMPEGPEEEKPDPPPEVVIIEEGGQVETIKDDSSIQSMNETLACAYPSCSNEVESCFVSSGCLSNLTKLFDELEEGNRDWTTLIPTLTDPTLLSTIPCVVCACEDFIKEKNITVSQDLFTCQDSPSQATNVSPLVLATFAIAASLYL